MISCFNIYNKKGNFPSYVEYNKTVIETAFHITIRQT